MSRYDQEPGDRDDWITFLVIGALLVLIGLATFLAMTSKPEDTATEKIGEFIYQLRA